MPKPEATITEGPCLNRNGTECGPGMKEITSYDVCFGTEVTELACHVNEEFTKQTGACECPRVNERFGREWRWEVSSNVNCIPEIERNRQQFW